MSMSVNNSINAYRAFILNEIYITLDDITNLKVQKSSLLASSQVQRCSNFIMEKIDKIYTLNRILWCLEAIKALNIREDVQFCLDLENMFNDFKFKKDKQDLLFRVKSSWLIDSVLAFIEKEKNISEDEISNVPIT